jgi:hypothetical protein
MDVYPPVTEGMENAEACETSPDKGNCAEGCEGEDECESASAGTCGCADVLGCGYVVVRCT